MTPKETKNLVKKAMTRDTDAFTVLMQLHMKNMYRVGLAILMNDEDVADAIQDTILACWENIHTLREPAFFKTWLTRILINKCYDVLRTAPQTLPLSEAVYNRPSPERGYNPELKEALSTLDEKYRSVMILFYSEGYHIAEIASILKLPNSTVKTRLQRGREKLAAYYDISERRGKK